MRRLPVLLVAVLAAAFAAALIARAGSAAGGTSFRTPDAGAKVVDALPWWDASTPVLHRWHRGAITCRAAGSAILCRNGTTAIRVSAAGFAVAS